MGNSDPLSRRDADGMASLVAEADALAARFHANQLDRAGVPYIAHCRAMAAAVRGLGPRFEIVGLLHDSLEDTDLSATAIEERFGSEVRAAVEAMTKQPGDDYFRDYLPRVLTDPIAKAVKRADTMHNLGQLDRLPSGETRDRLRAKYARVMTAIGDAER